MSEPSHFAILGTAGHIDHGKTALVRLLTGVDTDRLKEEKARGISIDLGFAHLDLPGGVSCGIVDVPGHERFVKNMLAGACGMDAVMLVIAADEGVMPQTREHLDILQLLGIERGLVAMTKTDMVEPDWLDLVTETVREYLGERGYGHFPVVPVSAKTGAGRDAVLDALAAVMREVVERPSSAAARLPVDRAFVVEGFGTVVTGTLWRGTIAPGDQLTVEPGSTPARVRNVEVHGETASRAHAGQRTAVSLAGLDRTEVPRGSWLVAPETLSGSHMLDVRIRMLPDTAKELVHRQRIRFHLGASEILGRVVLLEDDRLEPGRDAFAQLRLEAPAVADRGDRFVIRSYSPARAIAGGTVILPRASKLKRRDPAALERLHREESGSVVDRVRAAAEALPFGGAPGEIAAATGLSTAETAGALEELAAAGAVQALADGRTLAETALAALAVTARGVLEEAQARFPLRWGVSRGELKSRLGKGTPPVVFEAVVTRLGESGSIHQRRDHLRWGTPDPELGSEQKRLVGTATERLEAGDLMPPSVKELTGELGAEVPEALEYLTFQGVAVKVTPDLFVHRPHLERLESWIRDTLAASGELSVGELRAAFGMSRKFSVPILEHFDRQGLTRRAGDVRVPGRAFSEESAD